MGSFSNRILYQLHFSKNKMCLPFCVLYYTYRLDRVDVIFPYTPSNIGQFHQWVY